MQKTILITGATDGIGLETAKLLVAEGHKVLLHGRNPEKLENTVKAFGSDNTESYLADLSRMEEVEALAKAIADKHDQLDVLINNAGVFKTGAPLTADGLDVRFAVNTIAPYLLTKRLLPLIQPSGRVVNLSSAAQSPVDLNALSDAPQLGDMAAYSQSKQAITMWSRQVALSLPDGPVIVAVNPASMLGSKMVKEGFGVAGGDLGIGADILVRAALSEEFTNASGQYYDNDARRFAAPPADALDAQKLDALVQTIERVITQIL